MQFTKGKLCPKICHDTKLLEERQLENLFTTVHRCNLCQQEFNNKTDMGMMLHHETVHPEYFNNNIHTAKSLYSNMWFIKYKHFLFVFFDLYSILKNKSFSLQFW